MKCVGLRGCCAIVLLLVAVTVIQPARADSPPPPEPAPRIVNIVNFIRLLEPRSREITEQVLYETVEKQVELMKRHKLPGTFLLQYDALLDARYQELLKSLPAEQFEIGGWWELPQPLVEKAGLKWRGRYPWDWHADVGFVSGYTPAEREKLVDVYMADFKQIFGRYPKSVASWFIDEHTLAYMHSKYGVIASANCKDQVGTDGYTLWGGYWNQAYYPSKLNAYMPAQTAEGQIPVPIFRMLGSDPLRQYDTGIGGGAQGVISLEPVYGDSGGNRQWVDWFFKNLVKGECLAFNYTQAGQENSFTWNAIGRGLDYQCAELARLRDEGKVRVEPLATSGEWFRKSFVTTPATAMSFTSPLGDDHRQTVWFNSRFYRMNLLWQEGRLSFRDIHLFDERIESPIYRDRIASSAVSFQTLPLVDGYYWSSRETRAGLYAVATIDGKQVDITGGEPTIARTATGGLQVDWPLTNMAGTLRITLQDETARFELLGAADLDWELTLRTADGAKLPFKSIGERAIDCEFESTSYSVNATIGTCKASGAGYSLRPEGNAIELNMNVVNE